MQIQIDQQTLVADDIASCYAKAQRLANRRQRSLEFAIIFDSGAELRDTVNPEPGTAIAVLCNVQPEPANPLALAFAEHCWRETLNPVYLPTVGGFATC